MSAALGQLRPAAGGGSPDGELIIKANGQFITAWLGVSIRRAVDQMPSSFSIEATAKYPGEVRDLIPLNAPLQLIMGGNVVLTGYLERINNEINAEGHRIELVGRGRCCDLVDCSAILNGMQLSGASVGELARRLVQPFAGPISVLTPNGDGDKKDFIFVINLSESPYEILQRVCMFEGLLPYENGDGNLVLARVGTAKHASGFTEGQNVQAITRFDTRDERFSTYIPQLMSADTLSRQGAGANNAGTAASDPGIDRYRPKIIISEQQTAGSFLAQQRALWEALYRIGRSLRIELTCDSWLDSAGTPWTPNMLAPVSMPSIGLNEPELVITQVTYKRDGRTGTTCNVVLMPKDAISIEPSALMAIQARALSPSGQPGPLGDPTPAAATPTAQNSGGRRDIDSAVPTSQGSGLRDKG